MSIGQNDRYHQSSIQTGRGVATAAKPIGAWGGPFAMYQIVSVTHIMGVSENRGTPKSSILIGFSIINHPFWDTTILGNTHVRIILGVYIVKRCIGGFAPLLYQVLPSRGWKNPCHPFPEPAESVDYGFTIVFTLLLVMLIFPWFWCPGKQGRHKTRGQCVLIE